MASPWKDIGRYGTVGIYFVLTIIFLWWWGIWLDGRYWGGQGWGLVVGFLLGVTVGFRNLIRTAAQMQRDIERAEARDPQAGRWTVDPHWLHGDPPASDEEDVARQRSSKGPPSNDTSGSHSGGQR
jgi:hypothetical protein